MNTVEFLKALWPSQGCGYYVLATSHPNKKEGAKEGAKDWFRHHYFSTIEEAAAKVVEFREDKTLQVYFALHTYKELVEKLSKKGRPYMDVERVQTNTSHTRVLPMDMDVGESKPGSPKFPDQGAALRGLVDFLATTKLPKPTLVNSGYGVHGYWRFTRDVTKAEWQIIADKFQRLADHHKFYIDRRITTDSSRVLRPIHTWNRKDPDNPRQVALFTRLMAEVDPDELNAMLDELLVGVPAPRRGTVTTASGIILPESFAAEKPTPKKLMATCASFRRMVGDAATCSGSVWRPTVELLRHTTGGAEACHKVSEPHPQYDQEELRARLERYDAMDLGPPTCGTIHGVYATDSLCPSCPHFGQPHSSPIAFARRMPAKELPPDVPPPPQGFKRSKRGIEVEIEKEEDGDVITIDLTICRYDIYPTRIIDDPVNKRKAIDWRATLPIRGDVGLMLPIDTHVDDNKLMTQLANHGVIIEKRNAKQMGRYMSLYIQELQKFAAEQTQVETMGWIENYTRFNLPDGSHGEDGIKPTVMAARMLNAAAAFKTGGTLEGQVSALQFYNHPAYVKQQIVICIALAAPLFYMTGHHGVLVNLNGESGASKSTAMLGAGGIWGEPEKIVMNGTASGATQNARMQRLEILANLPVFLDDISDMDPALLKQLAMGVTQAGGKIGLHRDGTERFMPENLKSTVMIMSSNPSMHDVLSQGNAAGSAGSMRVWEMRCEPLTIHTKRQADEFLRQTKLNYGHIGPMVIDYVLRNRATVQAMMQEVVELVEDRGRIIQQERFWSTAMAVAVLGARLGRLLGFLSYDPDYMLRWLTDEQLPSMRGTVKESYLTPLAALQGFMADANGHLLNVSKHGVAWVLNGEAPRGTIMGRYEPGNGAMWITVQAFRHWCLVRKLSFDQISRDLAKAAIVTREKMDPTRFILGQDLGLMACLKIDLRHADLAGVVEKPEENVVQLADRRKSSGV